MEGLAGYVIRRLLFLPVILLVVSFATFYITRWGPGDPLTVYGAKYSDDETLDRVREQYLAQIPARRYCEPSEIASVVDFLASDKASYVNGAVIDVNGGWLMP